jgi:RNase P/RNase MRP subunit p30
MRKFIDLHLKPPGDAVRIRAMLELAAELGFSGVATAFDNSPPKFVREMALSLGLDLVDRVDLRPRNTGDLIATLRRIRRRVEIIAVECHSKAVARQAAKDHRVDILNFPAPVSARKRVRFDRQEASLASGSNCAYEINVSDLLRLGPIAASKLVSILRVEVENAKRHDVPIVLSSGSENPLLMREPRGLAAILVLLDVEEEVGLDAVSTNPWGMVETNREKLGPGFVVPGVRVV